MGGTRWHRCNNCTTRRRVMWAVTTFAICALALFYVGGMWEGHAGTSVLSSPRVSWGSKPSLTVPPTVDPSPYFQHVRSHLMDVGGMDSHGMLGLVTEELQVLNEDVGKHLFHSHAHHRIRAHTHTHTLHYTCRVLLDSPCSTHPLTSRVFAMYPQET